RYVELARRTLLAFAGDLARTPHGMEAMASVVGELLGPPRPEAAAEGRGASRVIRGPVTLEGSLQPSRLAPGEAGEARVSLEVSPGFGVTAHRPTAAGASSSAPKNLAGLAVAVPGETLSPGSPQYPEGRRLEPDDSDSPLVYTGRTTIVIPVRASVVASPGDFRMRLRVVYQVCRKRGCDPPERVLLEAPLTIAGG